MKAEQQQQLNALCHQYIHAPDEDKRNEIFWQMYQLCQDEYQPLIQRSQKTEPHTLRFSPETYDNDIELTLRRTLAAANLEPQTFAALFHRSLQNRLVSHHRRSSVGMHGGALDERDVATNKHHDTIHTPHDEGAYRELLAQLPASLRDTFQTMKSDVLLSFIKKFTSPLLIHVGSQDYIETLTEDNKPINIHTAKHHHQTLKRALGGNDLLNQIMEYADTSARVKEISDLITETAHDVLRKRGDQEQHSYFTLSPCTNATVPHLR